MQPSTTSSVDLEGQKGGAHIREDFSGAQGRQMDDAYRRVVRRLGRERSVKRRSHRLRRAPYGLWSEAHAWMDGVGKMDSMLHHNGYIKPKARVY